MTTSEGSLCRAASPGRAADYDEGARHLPFAIGTAERDAWLGCMREALAESIGSEDARAAIEGSMARLADFMRNRNG